MGKQMDRLMSLTRYQIIRMKEMDEFHLLNDDPQCVNVCFWYVPKRLRGQDLTEEVKIELGKVRLDKSFFATKALHHHYSLILLKGECILICYKSLLLTSLAKPAAFLSQFTQDACTLKTRKFVFKKLNFGNFRFSCHKTKIDFFLRNFGPHAKE